MFTRSLLRNGRHNGEKERIAKRAPLSQFSWAILKALALLPIIVLAAISTGIVIGSLGPDYLFILLQAPYFCAVRIHSIL